MLYTHITVESQFLVPPGETQIGSRNRRVRESGVKLQCLTEERERLLVRVIGRFEKMSVREIGIPLCIHLFIKEILFIIHSDLEWTPFSCAFNKIEDQVISPGYSSTHQSTIREVQ